MGRRPIPATYSAHTPPRRNEKRLYLASPATHIDNTLKVSDVNRLQKNGKAKDYSELFGKPGSALFGCGNVTRAVEAGGGEKHPFDASTWVPPLLVGAETPVKDGKRKEEVVGTAGLGYFVFPPSGSNPSGPANTVGTNTNASPNKVSSSTSAQTKQPPSSPSHPPQPSSSSTSHKPKPHQPHNDDASIWDTDHLAALHRARLAREALEAQKGEEYWVSCGGVLRDANGKRDLVRTKKVKEELELREREKRLLEVWEEYERRWAEMVRKVRGSAKGKNGKGKGREDDDMKEKDEDEMQGVEEDEEDEDHLKFSDIPWPIHTAFSKPPPAPSPSHAPLRVSSLSFKSSPQPPSSSPYPPPPEKILADLTPANIRTFLLDPLSVRGSKVTARERIRGSMLRWHPDKMGGVVERVKGEEERGMVVRGVHEVVRTLQGLLSEVGRERNGQGNGA